jgi:hypothetical protein
METKIKKTGESGGVSSGPLRIYNDDGKLFVTGFGLWIPIETEKEGLELIYELELQGYRICH